MSPPSGSECNYTKTVNSHMMPLDSAILLLAVVVIGLISIMSTRLTWA